MSIAAKTVSSAAPSYDAIVVGSGYGGGVAASRLARMGLRVAVLEQGRLWRPGDFPTTISARRKTTRFTGRAKLGDPAGLYYLSVGNGLTVFGASGLGGGSLINAGVVLRPDFARLQRLGWPSEVTGDGLFEQGLAQRATQIRVGSLGPQTIVVEAELVGRVAKDDAFANVGARRDATQAQLGQRPGRTLLDGT